jgi:hypothetical protein
MVVVLPVPFTPTMRMTAGLCATSMRVSAWEKWAAVMSRSRAMRVAESLISPASASASKDSTMDTVVSTPTSAKISASSMCSHRSSSKRSKSTEANCCCKALRLLLRPSRSWANQPLRASLACSEVPTERPSPTPMKTSDQL